RAGSTFARMAQRLADASHRSDHGARVVLESLFSILNLFLGLLLVVRRPRDRAARLLAVGMVGTAATFNHQAPAVYRLDLLGSDRVTDVGNAVFPALFALIPVALVVGILRYRLWDIDVVISRTLLSLFLAVFIGVVYVVVVVGLGQALGAGDSAPVLQLAATVVAAVAFEPVRERLQRFANRLVYGRRATPQEVMTGYAERLG